MNAKAWFFSGGSFVLLGVLWLFVWLLGFTSGNAWWMVGVAVCFLIVGMGQTAEWRRRNTG